MTRVIKTQTPFGAELIELIAKYHPQALSGDIKETDKVVTEMGHVLGGMIAIMTVFHGKRVGFALTQMVELDILIGVTDTLDMTSEENNTPDKIWEDIGRVGPEKPLGYLPIVTLDKYCGKSPADVLAFAETKGLRAHVFNEFECRIGSGAVYVWHAPALDALLDENCETLNLHGWPLNADDFAHRVAKDHADDPVLYRVIGLAFADWRFTEGGPAAAPQGEPLGGDGFGIP